MNGIYSRHHQGAEDTIFHLLASAETDLLSILHESGVPPHPLSLKIGCIASTMRNLSVKNARVQVVNLLTSVIEVRLLQQLQLISEQADSTFYLPQIMFELKPQRANWTVQRRQFPLRFTYATIFNSCQGLTLDRVVLDLTMPAFAHGQLYTRLSRVRTASDIHILREPR